MEGGNKTGESSHWGGGGTGGSSRQHDGMEVRQVEADTGVVKLNKTEASSQGSEVQMTGGSSQWLGKVKIRQVGAHNGLVR